MNKVSLIKHLAMDTSLSYIYFYASIHQLISRPPP